MLCHKFKPLTHKALNGTSIIANVTERVCHRLQTHLAETLRKPPVSVSPKHIDVVGDNGLLRYQHNEAQAIDLAWVNVGGTA
jgi:hypothetical protein